MTTTLIHRPQGYTETKKFDSSVIREAFFDAPTNRLFLKLTSGSTAGYEGISCELWRQLSESASAGKFWNRHIRRHYKGVSGDVEFFPRSEITVKEDTTIKNVGQPTVTMHLWKVTVEVIAPSVTVAVNEVTSQGLKVIAVN